MKRNAFASPVAILAVGAPGVGMVQVYRCGTNGCAQVGSNIVHQDSNIEFGRSVSLSEGALFAFYLFLYCTYSLNRCVIDGSMVAVGAMDGVRFWSGYDVEVYKKQTVKTDGEQWIRFGNPISVSWQLYSDNHPGYYVSLAGNGEGIAVGTIFVQYVGEDRRSVRSVDLHVQLHKWNADLEEWGPAGSAISKTHYIDATPRSEFPLQSIKLSHDSSVLAIGSSNSADVYHWDESALNWVPREIDLNVTDSMGLVG